MDIVFNPVKDPLCEITGKEADIFCECMTCQAFRETAKPPTPVTKTLYAMCYEFHDPQQCGACQGMRGECWWQKETEYTHADTVEEARQTFLVGEMCGPFRHFKLVAIAPVIGYKVMDKQGKHLSV